MTILQGRRITLRPLRAGDYRQWTEVRTTNSDWLLKWEPARSPGAPDVVSDPGAFASRCRARDRESQLGVGFGFGIFLDGTFIGEANLSSVQRGPFQNAYIGYWIDERHAGCGYVPEAVVVLLSHAFDKLDLHRVQISIIPRNTTSRRVVEKLAIREEGTAERYLEINGVWEDHVRYAITVEEWSKRGNDLLREWVWP